MHTQLSRRGFIAAGAASISAGAWSLDAHAQAQQPPERKPMPPLPFPLMDLHVHLDKSTIDDVFKLSEERGVKFGIVEHAGTKENVYPVILSNDAELNEYIRMLAPKAVYKGLQAEWNDWSACFSREALAQLDFVLGDAMTFPGKDGRRMKLWEPSSDIGEPAAFMERFVDWHIDILTNQPIDLLANVSWLPAALSPAYDDWWSEPRMARVIEAAVKHDVAIEISSAYSLPKLPFLNLAKQAGAKFAFGSNGRYPKMGLLDYPIEMARALGLAAADMFVPHGAKAARAQ